MIKPSALLTHLLYPLTSYFVLLISINHVCPGKPSWIHRKLFFKGIYFFIYGKLFILELVRNILISFTSYRDIEHYMQYFPCNVCYWLLKQYYKSQERFCLLLKREMPSSFKALSQKENMMRPAVTWIFNLCIWICLLSVHNKKEKLYELMCFAD